MHVLSTFPADGAGTECPRGDPGCGVPVDTEIRVALDRPLLPASGVRQAVDVTTGDAPVPLVSPRYDLLTRELVFRFASNLAASALYRVELAVPASDEDAGLRAFDGAPLEAGPVPLTWNFVTAGADSRAPEPPAVPVEPGCADVVAIFRTSCADGCCHGGAEPAMGLGLGDEAALASGVRRVARQTDTAQNLGVALVNPARFGVAMPLVDPGAPATSYLVYKLLLHSENLAPCTSGCEPFAALPDAERCVALSEDERERLREWFVRGEAMPLNRGRTLDGACRNVPVERHLDCGALRALTRFIENGADCH